jgi:cyclohexanone monooxygenase
MKARQVTHIGPTAEGGAGWTQTIHQQAKDVRDFLSQCTPGYHSGEGDLDKGLLVDGYDDGSLEFSKVIAEWRHDGRMKGLVLLRSRRLPDPCRVFPDQQQMNGEIVL